MTVFDNVGFGLRVRNRPKQEIRERVRELLKLVQLDGYERSMPSQLSGGQRQRVALARALAAQPKVLLLDEPFGALDAKVRTELRQWLRRLHDELHVTSVFVTHDQEEAFEVADRVVIMNKGKIEQTGTPTEIFDEPATPFVMDFLGNVNVFHGSVQGGRARLGTLELDYPEYTDAESREAMAFVRSHELEILRTKNGRPSLEAKVTHVNPARPVVKVRVYSEAFGVLLNVDVSWERFAELRLAPGDTVYVSPRQMRVFVQDYVI
jgi:sulfate transport system ATP-binding protein